MNPEFRRNLWLELTPRRMALAAGLLGLIFFAASLSGGIGWPATLAQILYYIIVVLWGSRNAALSVVGEIRDRTWDLQRLSSLSAHDMTWGKLFGATVYNWYAGGLCLAVIIAQSFATAGVLGAVTDFIYYIELGVIAQAAALLASLVAVRRREPHSRAEVFVYQLAGIIAAIGVEWVWEASNPSSLFALIGPPTEFITWWGGAFDARGFLLVSLALFTAWTLVGCYREMRLELKMQNGPLVWLGFLAFIGIYVAGFDNLLSHTAETADWDVAALRLGLAATVFAVLTYVMVFLEPKDRVHFRWLGVQVAESNIVRALMALPGFMMSYLATFVVSLLLIIWLWAADPAARGDPALIAAGLGFITRDVALFVLVHVLPGRRRGDFAAVMTLFTVYILVPSILSGLGLYGPLVVFYPRPVDPMWLATIIAWAEAVILVAAAMGRIALSEKPPSRVETAPA